MPPEKEFSRKVVVVVGGGSGIGRETALQIAARGGHVVVADANAAAAAETAAAVAALSSDDMVQSAALDLTVARHDRGGGARGRAAVRRLRRRSSTPRRFIRRRIRRRPRRPSGAGRSPINVTSNFVLAQEAAKVLKAQKLPASIVLTSSANAVVPKAGSEAYDVSKAAINHLIRELAVGARPARPRQRHRAGDRDRGIVDVPARPRHRVAEEVQHRLRASRNRRRRCATKLAEFYAQRTITRQPILPIDNANAICWLAGDQSAKTTGHVIPVDGGLPEAFLR